MDTKIERRFLQISTAAFVFSLIPQLLQTAFSLFLRNTISFNQQIALFLTVYPFAIYAVTPVLVFIVFYFIGKKTNLTLELRLAIVALLIGNFAAALVGEAVFFTVTPSELTVANTLYDLASLLLRVFGSEFFVALAALSIAHIRRNKTMLTAEPDLH